MERKGVLYFIPFIAVVVIVIWKLNTPLFEVSFAEHLPAPTFTSMPTSTPAAGTSGIADTSDSEHVLRKTVSAETTTPKASATKLFPFDPNTVTIQQLCSLGFTAKTAAGIIKYRERGKRFEIPEDFATCYGVTIEHYTLLEPYIVIGDEFKPRPKAAKSVSAAVEPGSVHADTVSSAAPAMSSAPSSSSFVKPLVEINTADSAALRAVSGIGEVLVVRIIDYRARLGGFARADQLAEIKGMTEDNYNRIITQIKVDSCEIQKIDVNFATHKNLVEQMGRHPYVTDKMLRKLLKHRQLKGGWSTHGDMVEDEIMTKQEAERLAPYLLFRTPVNAF